MAKTKTTKVRDFDKDGWITEDGRKRLRAILKQFDAPMKALRSFDDGCWADDVKHDLKRLREQFL